MHPTVLIAICAGLISGLFSFSNAIDGNFRVALGFAGIVIVAEGLIILSQAIRKP